MEKEIVDFRALLRALGYNVESAELHTDAIGPATRLALRQFQRGHLLPESGLPDLATIRKLQEEADSLPSLKGDIAGRVQFEGPNPIQALTVRAYEKKLRGEEYLGYTAVDTHGDYRVEYMRRSVPGDQPDLFVRVYAEGLSNVAESSVLFNAPRSARIDVRVTSQGLQREAEYYRVIRSITPALDSVPLAALSDDDLVYLAKSTGVDRECIAQLRAAARLARDTALPDEVTFALVTQNLPSDAKLLLNSKAEVIRRALAQAVKANAVPSWVSEKADAVVRHIGRVRVEAALAVRREAHGRVLDDSTGAAIPGIVVRVIDLNESPERPLGFDVTDDKGEFRISYVASANSTHRLRMDVLDEQRTVVQSLTVDLAAGSDIIPDFRIPSTRVAEPLDMRIDELSERLHLGLPAGVRARLAERRMETLRDLLARPEALATLPAEDRTHVQLLRTHAGLAVLSPAAETRAKLITSGFTTPEVISRESLASFVEATHTDIGDFAAARLYVEARSQTVFGQNLRAHLRTRSLFAPAPDLDPLLDTVSLEQPGECTECQSALSPSAYLVELLRYVLDYVTVAGNSNSMTVEELSSRFGQPFGSLPAGCIATEELVPQVRLCVEVLRRVVPVQEDALQAALEAYLTPAYTALLNRTGTSYEDLRLAHAGTLSDRQALASRIGIDLTDGDPDRIDRMLLPPQLLTEGALERLFGLPDTSRDPLSTGGKGGDDSSQIARWQVTGIEFDPSGDPDGVIFAQLTKPEPNRYRVAVYRDRERTHLLASGERDTPEGSIVLLPEETSRVSGRVEIRYTTGADAVELWVMPAFLAWRLARLRSTWLDQEFGGEDAPKRSPVIDPDRIGPGDFRNPYSGDPAYDLWAMRKTLVEDQMAALRNIREAAATVLEGFEAVTTALRPGLSEEIATIDEQRNRGENIVARLEELQLSAAAFNYLVRIRNLTVQAAEVLTDEWENIYSILTQARKRSLFASWRQQEHDGRIVAGPDHFVLRNGAMTTIDEVRLPAWRATAQQRREWEQMLEARLDGQNSLITAFWQGVQNTAQEHLPAFRDALVEATAETGDFSSKAKALSVRLLIDTGAAGCAMTTRLQQAIETLQLLLWAVRTRQATALSDLLLSDDDFDSAWQWIGSYETWRAAAEVFLYPENFLQPGLRQRQTPAFQRLITDSTTTSLTPAGACELASAYGEYFAGVLQLLIEASCTANTLIPAPAKACEERTPEMRPVQHLFGRAPGSKRVYTSFDVSEPTAFAQSFWRVVPGLENVTQIVGASEYDDPFGRRYVYLFAVADDPGSPAKSKLMCSRRDLDTGAWDEQPFTLQLPPNTASFRCCIVQRNEHRRPPAVMIAVRGYSGDPLLYHERLTKAGDGWDQPEGWKPLFPYSRFWSRFNTLLAAVAFGGSEILLFQQDGESIFRGVVTERRSLIWEPFGTGEWRGAICWPSETPKVYSFWREAGEERYAIFWDTRYRAKPWVEPAWFLKGIRCTAPHCGPRTEPAESMRLAVQTGKGNYLYVVGTTLPIVPPDAPSVMYREPNVILGDADGDDPPGDQPQPEDPEPPPPNSFLMLSRRLRLNPSIAEPPSIRSGGSDADLALRRAGIVLAFINNADAPPSSTVYLEEAYYFVPVQLALQLKESGEYIAALDWLRTVYNYGGPAGDGRKIYHGLRIEESLSSLTQAPAVWFGDLDPHALASTRQNAYTTFTLRLIIECLLGFADAEFTRDTSESLARARTLYTTAWELLDGVPLKPAIPSTEMAIDEFEGELATALPDAAGWKPERDDIVGRLRLLPPRGRVRDTLSALQNVVSDHSSDGHLLSKLRNVVERALATSGRTVHPRVGDLLSSQNEPLSLMANTSIESAIRSLAADAAQTFGAAMARTSELSLRDLENTPTSLPWLRQADDQKYLRVWSTMQFTEYLTGVPAGFCVPYNPVLDAMRRHTDVNLQKLRTCRNIAGWERPIPLSSTATAQSGTVIHAPTQYRYSALILRAKESAAIAQQLEAAFLSVLEKRDAETYGLIRARQDLQLSRAGVTLQNLRVNEAITGVDIARIQMDRARVERDYYSNQLSGGLGLWEALSLAGSFVTLAASVVAIPGAGAGLVAGAAASAGAVAAAAGAGSSFLGQLAGIERRRTESEFQLDLARQDVAIAQEQIAASENLVKVVRQELAIAQLQSDHAGTAVNFLARKFTNADLYEWMAGVLGSIYRYFLQHATATASLASRQLTFERQEQTPAFIQSDYWQTADTSSLSDRLGMTGSARLLQDIHRLDQYAFETDKRKLQLTKTISLFQLSPGEFQQFRETGVHRFRTTEDMFDRDFPGHYLRTIKQVRTSVIALIPPLDGIKATLSSSGISRVVTNGAGQAQTAEIRRPPESIALTSPQQATGVFELSAEPQILMPFEGSGVDTSWELRMPLAANQLDFKSIADVLITLDYTALSSGEYARQVQRRLRDTVRFDRAFSIRRDFPDAWYDLHNPDQTSTPLRVSFTIDRKDFPPNLDEFRIAHVAVYLGSGDHNAFVGPAPFDIGLSLNTGDYQAGSAHRWNRKHPQRQCPELDIPGYGAVWKLEHRTTRHE